MYLRRVAALTRLTKDLVCSVRSSAASALPTCDWDRKWGAAYRMVDGFGAILVTKGVTDAAV